MRGYYWRGHRLRRIAREAEKITSTNHALLFSTFWEQSGTHTLNPPWARCNCVTCFLQGQGSLAIGSFKIVQWAKSLSLRLAHKTHLGGILCYAGSWGDNLMMFSGHGACLKNKSLLSETTDLQGLSVNHHSIIQTLLIEAQAKLLLQMWSARGCSGSLVPSILQNSHPHNTFFLHIDASLVPYLYSNSGERVKERESQSMLCFDFMSFYGHKVVYVTAPHTPFMTTGSQNHTQQDRRLRNTAPAGQSKVLPNLHQNEVCSVK